MITSYIVAGQLNSKDTALLLLLPLTVIFQETIARPARSLLHTPLAAATAAAATAEL